MMKKTLFAALAAAMALVGHSRDWYIDAVKGDDSGDGSEAKPYLTINMATTNSAFAAGDTVRLAPGDYDRDYYEVNLGKQGIDRSRVYINKSATIVATEGAEKTRIVGKLVPDDPKGYQGAGNGAIRCIKVDNKKAVVTIEGLTLVNGGTAYTNQNSSVSAVPNLGAAVYGQVATNFYLVDCVVSNCATYGAVMQYGMAVRTRFVDNNAGKYVLRNANAYKCLMDNNQVKSGGYVSYASKFIGCTVICGANSVAYLSSSVFGNSIAIGSSGSTLPSIAGTITNSIRYSQQLFATNALAINPFFAPFDRDFRLVSNGNDYGLIGRGDKKIVDYYFGSLLPAKYIDQSEVIHIGCFDAVVPAGGAIYSPSAVTVNGELHRMGSYTGCYIAYPAKLPFGVMFRRRDDVAGGVTTVYDFARDIFATPASEPVSDRVFPSADGAIFQCAPADVASTVRLTWSAIKTKLYVNASSSVASDSNTGTDEDMPLKTIQRAINLVSSDNTVISVAGGTYNSLYSTIACNPANHFFRLAITNRACAIRATGAAIVKGQADSSTKGKGSNAISCAYVGDSVSGPVQLQGLTFDSGYSADNADYGAAALQGAAVYGNGKAGTFVSDCTITNCFGAGSVGANATFQRCLFAGIAASRTSAGTANTVIDSVCAACVFKGDNAADSVVAGDSALYNCTLLPTYAGSVIGAGVECANCLVDAAKCPCATISNLGGNFMWNYSSDSDLGAWILEDPVIADPDGGEFHLVKKSPAIGRGVMPMGGGFFSYSCVDADSLPILSDAGMMPGAFYGNFASVVKISAAQGGLAVDGGVIGANPVTDDLFITISKSEKSTRPTLGFTVNGVTNLFAVTPSRSFTKADVDAAGGALNIQAIYTSDWYVNVSTGSDEADGYTPETAFRTIARALSNEGLTAMDTVHVAAGTYDEGEMSCAYDLSTMCTARATVPPRVTLEGAGAATTTIVGGEQIRCVFLRSGSSIRGFTLSGGRLANAEPGSAEYPGYYDTAAAGLCGEGYEKCVATDCIISGNEAYNSAGGAKATFLRCKFLDNIAHNQGSAGADSRFSNCYFDRNRGRYVTMSQQLYGCTFGTENVNIDGVSETLLAYHVPGEQNWDTGIRYVNTVFPGACSTGHVFRACVVANDVTADYVYHPLDAGVVGEDSILIPKAEFTMDSEGRPGKSAVWIDRGSTSLWADSVGDISGDGTDLAGGQRVFNGAIDMGAYEFNWLSKYTELIACQGAEFVAAASNVTATAENTVKVPAGDGATVSWANAGGRSASYRMLVKVTGEGTLSVYVDGELACGPIAASGDWVSAEFKRAATESEVDFVFSGEGYAELGAFKKASGFVMLYR